MDWLFLNQISYRRVLIFSTLCYFFFDNKQNKNVVCLLCAKEIVFTFHIKIMRICKKETQQEEVFFFSLFSCGQSIVVVTLRTCEPDKIY